MLNRFFYTHVGAKYAIVAFILFCIFFEPISFILKITGLNALMRQVGLLNSNGMFSFEMALMYSILFVLFAFVVGIVYSFYTNIKYRQIAKKNKEKGYFRFNY